MNRKYWYILSIILVFIAVGIYTFTQKKSNQNLEQEQTNQDVVLEDTTNTKPQTDKVITETEILTDEVDTSGWLTYRNEEYGFEFKYPEDWHVCKEENNHIEICSLNTKRIEWNTKGDLTDKISLNVFSSFNEFKNNYSSSSSTDNLKDFLSQGFIAPPQTVVEKHLDQNNAIQYEVVVNELNTTKHVFFDTEEIIYQFISVYEGNFKILQEIISSFKL